MYVTLHRGVVTVGRSSGVTPSYPEKGTICSVICSFVSQKGHSGIQIELATCDLDRYKAATPLYAQEEVDCIRWLQEQMQDLMLRYSMEYYLHENNDLSGGFMPPGEEDGVDKDTGLS